MISMIMYQCKGCGSELFKFERVGQDFYGVRTPTEIMGMYSNKCPKCGKQLEIPSISDILLRQRVRVGFGSLNVRAM
ncbi:hypothetical protein HS1genome_0974 [Sulfodiicoccus acidiphilus]|uniref:Uncharacterized protein n=1 Tax=Sulfodiicoccus acidiphilus TaxID=1670455 RepID=A0A348B333_9CREN|nr:hypothetical protein HS1genome_0974 [Sulfodiicoccus acidiphilus]GGT93502.1 hypothetical protein GCM10007116_09010 [Sulfodiicoccus acidiphilus]